jgi:hypothetical protein
MTHFRGWIVFVFEPGVGRPWARGDREPSGRRQVTAKGEGANDTSPLPPDIWLVCCGQAFVCAHNPAYSLTRLPLHISQVRRHVY